MIESSGIAVTSAGSAPVEPKCHSGGKGQVHPMLQEAFAALDRVGIAWCVLRGEQDLAQPRGDVDLLVLRTDRERLDAVLTHLGFAAIPARGRGTHSFFVGYHRATGQWLSLDVVTELAYGPLFALATRAEDGCLRRRGRWMGVSVLAPDDAFWTLLLHCLLDKRRFAQHHAARLQDLAAAASLTGPLASVVAAVGPPECSPRRLRDAVGRGDWARLEHLSSRLVRSWMLSRPGQIFPKAAARRLERLTEKLVVWRRRRGLSAALLGPDGTGKSTLARDVAADFHWPSATVYMGLWRADDRPGRNRWRSLLRAAARPISIWRRYLTARAHQICGRAVVFDRYVYDAWLPPRPPFVAAKRLYFWGLARACPAPDLVMLLDAPTEAIFGRGKGETREEIAWQRKHFTALSSRLPGLHVIDADRPHAEVKAEVVDRLWQAYVRRWSAER